MQRLRVYILLIPFLCRAFGYMPVRSHFKRIRSARLNLQDATNVEQGSTPEVKKDIIVEIISTRRLGDAKTEAEKRTMAFDSVYKEYKEDRIAEVIENPLFRVFGILFNPTSMLVALYLSSIGWSKVLWLQRILKIFGRGTLVKDRKEGTPVPEEELPFQTFECEVCKLQIRPARGRAEAIFGRPRFRCSRCGSKAEAFFDVEDMEDDRAVARLERLEAENNDQFNDDDEDGAGDFYDDDDDDDEEVEDDDDVDFSDD